MIPALKRPPKPALKRPPMPPTPAEEFRRAAARWFERPAPPPSFRRRALRWFVRHRLDPGPEKVTFSAIPTVSASSGERRNRTEDATLELFEPRFGVDDDRCEFSLLQSNWPWMPTPDRPSRAVDRPDPSPGVYSPSELCRGFALLVHLVLARRRGPVAARLFDEVWAQYVLGPRAPGETWQDAARRAYWRGEVAALRSPEMLAREDAKKK